MNYSDIYIFGYGSLINERSARDIGPCDFVSYAEVVGYKRHFNALSGSHVYLNLVEECEHSVEGVVLKIPPCSIDNLMQREVGYDLVLINDKLSKKFSEPVYAFIMKEDVCCDRTVQLSYIATCLVGLPSHQWHAWLKDSVLDYKIYDDIADVAKDHYACSQSELYDVQKVVHQLFPTLIVGVV